MMHFFGLLSVLFLWFFFRAVISAIHFSSPNAAEESQQVASLRELVKIGFARRIQIATENSASGRHDSTCYKQLCNYVNWNMDETRSLHYAKDPQKSLYNYLHRIMCLDKTTATNYCGCKLEVLLLAEILQRPIGVYDTTKQQLFTFLPLSLCDTEVTEEHRKVCLFFIYLSLLLL